MNIDRLERIELERFERAQGTMTQPFQITKNRILRFADEMFKYQKGTPWNGRQIRNAFQVASSLAHYDARRDDCPPKLTVEHFKTILSVTEDFDEFMTETHGGRTAKEQAYERGDRADHYQSRWQVDDGSGDKDGSDDSSSGGRPNDPRHQQRQIGFFRGADNRRSRSPNVAAVQTGARPTIGGGIFGTSFGSKGVRQPPRTEQEGFNPSIKVTTSGGRGSELTRRGSDHTEMDLHLSPDHTSKSQWRRKYSGSGGSDLKRIRDENANLQEGGQLQKATKRRRKDYEYKEEANEENEE